MIRLSEGLTMPKYNVMFQSQIILKSAYGRDDIGRVDQGLVNL